MTKNQIIAKLRKNGWHRKNWRWFTPKRWGQFRRGVDLRAAASIEGMSTNDNLTERPRIKPPTVKQYSAAAVSMAVAHSNIVTCARCGWPVWQGETCKRCGHSTR